MTSPAQPEPCESRPAADPIDVERLFREHNTSAFLFCTAANLVTDRLRQRGRRRHTTSMGDMDFAAFDISPERVVASEQAMAKTMPAATVMWKATDDLRLYANYMTSFEASPNSVAPLIDGYGRTVVNAGEVQAPLENSQVEIGAKYSLGNTLFTAALFQIDKALELFVPLEDPTQSRLVQDGRQVHKGLELTVSGRPTANLTLIGGATFLDPEIEENDETPAVVGSAPQNVAERQIKLYGEYDLPAVQGLTFTAGVYHTGSQELTVPNSFELDSFTTADLGVRYATQVWNDRKLVLRLNVNNVTDEQYWLNSTYLGYPRTFAFGAQLQF
jgi:iron complex outermembrane receptor protein